MQVFRTLARTWYQNSFSGRPVQDRLLLTVKSCPDPEVLAEVEEWKKNLANYSTLVVGKTLVFLNGTSEECRFRECNLGDLICDAMVRL